MGTPKLHIIRVLIFFLAILYGCGGRSVENNSRREEPEWSRIGPGGGGAMFWPAISPHDPDIVCVACDMTGSYITYNGGESWRMFNLRGPVRFFAFDPVNPDIIYANSIALFKSTDCGITWNIVYPKESEIISIISKGDHADEQLVTVDSTRRMVLAFAVDPSNSMNLHAVFSIDRKTGYFTSDDQGKSWKKELEMENDARNIFIDQGSPVNNRTICITSKNYISVKENGNWFKNRGPSGVNIINEYAAGYDSLKQKLIIYAISGKSYFNPEASPSGIYYSEDKGKTWENRQDDILRFCQPGSEMPEWRTIATCSTNPRIAYVSYSGLNVSSDTILIGVAKSEDYGMTWKLVWKDNLTRNGGIFSSNYEKGWIDERFGPGWGENPFSIAVAPGDPDICFTTDFGRTIRTPDGGEKWQQVYTRRKEGAGWISRGLDVTTGYNIFFDPFVKSHVFIANTDIGLMESNDWGESWESATNNNGIPRNWVNSTYWLAFDDQIKGRVWAAMSDIHDLPRPKMWRRRGPDTFKGGIVNSSDGGKTWNPVSRDIGEAAITHILIDPESSKDSRTLYACAFGRGVFKSLDGGRSWTNKSSGIEGSEPFAWRLSMSKNGELFLIVCRKSEDGSIGNELDGALYRSDDGAENWVKMKLPEGTNGPMDISIDNKKPGRLILSAWGRVSPGKYRSDTGGGIFLSTDDGKSWKQTLGKDQHIHDITFDKRNETYYACGFNGSAYRSEDRGETWNRIRGYNFKWGKRVEPDLVDSSKIYIITFGGGVWHGPAKGDELSDEDIVSSIFRK